MRAEPTCPPSGLPRASLGGQRTPDRAARSAGGAGAGHSAAPLRPRAGRTAPAARPAGAGRHGHGLPRRLARRARRGRQGPARRRGRRERRPRGAQPLPARARRAAPGPRPAPRRGARRRRRGRHPVPRHPLRPGDPARRPGHPRRAAARATVCGRSPGAWPTPSPPCTPRGSCTATSPPATCSCSTASRTSSTSVSPPPRTSPRSPAAGWSSARRATSRPSRSPARW